MSARTSQMNAGPGGHRGEFDAPGTSIAAQAVWTAQGEFPGLERRRWQPPATSSSTARWRAGSRRSTPGPGSCSGSSRPARGSSASRSPIGGPDGHQYVAILSGVGGWAGAIVSGDLDPRDGTAALGFVNAMNGSQDVTTKGGTLYVFRLP